MSEKVLVVNDSNGLALKRKNLTDVEGFAQPTDEQTAAAVAAWLDDHPEATTTVEDGSLTDGKFSDALKLATIKDYVTPEMYGATGDGTTDDTASFEDAVNTGKLVFCSQKYKITDKIQLIKGVTGPGEIIFSGNGCFTVSVGTLVSDITVRTSGKFLDFIDTDITSSGSRNVNARVIFKDISIICESGAGTIFDIKARTYGFFNMVFKNINFTKQCSKCIDLSTDENVSSSWITQIYFVDCMFGAPLCVITASNIENIIMERCTSQMSANNATNLLYSFTKCRNVNLINCCDWDFTSTAKIYKFTDCTECGLIGNNRIIGNFDMTLTDFYKTFRVLQTRHGYSPQLYNKACILQNDLYFDNTTLFDEDFTGYFLMPVHGVLNGDCISAIRVTNAQQGYHGVNSYDLAVTSEGKLKVRLRVYDYDTPADASGHRYTKWSDWYTFSPDT